MTASLTFAGALLVSAAAATAVPAAAASPEQVDVAYQELSQGRAQEAIERIRANDRIATDDPAALINMGTAYAKMGKTEQARECFEAAIASNDRYELELSDGRWMDSRRAARLAIEKLDQSEARELRGG